MRFDDGLYVLGVEAEYGTLVPAAEAVADGRYDPEWAARTGYVSASVADRAAPELALAAARRALKASGLDGPEQVRDRVRLHLHACVYHQGVDLWPSSCYVLDRVGGGGSALTCQVGAMSNSAMAAFELAGRFLDGRGRASDAVLVTSGDRFCEPGYRRWASERNTIFGDAGTAVVLGRSPGIAKVLACASHSDPGLEGMIRGDAPFTPASTLLTEPAALGERMRQFAARSGGTEAVVRRKTGGTVAAVEQVLRFAGVSMEDVRWVLTPFFGRPHVRDNFLTPLGIAAGRTMTEFGLTVGHLGSSDPVAGLAHLVAEGLGTAGDLVLMLGMGGGYTWTPALLRLL
ncbi:3-oxoacyl-[acyl-carrier-protein] synthase III C-terminal domain-containing protein [Amycolatopsis sp. NPDC021455]|uniref:3-oxoacyl-[acyl-carrier-protein] synthase III C-terminal domain-containing protein n=1 Tax=Amycolatopsis sp. NPDC021455 TaxID=3154901 RepID=UPI0033D553AB